MPNRIDRPSRGEVLKQRCRGRAGNGSKGDRFLDNTSPCGGGGGWNCGVNTNCDCNRDYN